MRFRPNTQEVEAELFDGTNLLAGMDFDGFSAYVTVLENGRPYKQYASAGDYIVNFGRGNYRVRKAELFLASYEPVPAEEYADFQEVDPLETGLQELQEGQ